MSEFTAYWEGLTPDQKEDLARASDISEDILRQLARGNKKWGASTMARIYKVNPRFTPQVLRPDLYESHA